jgi:hypothetical protein
MTGNHSKVIYTPPGSRSRKHALVVIDLDVSPADAPGIMEQIAPYGAARFAEIVQEHGQPWPDTLTVRTPSGGQHLYYVAPPGREIRNSASRIGPKIDVRGAGGYVLAAGSVVGGRAYEVIATDDREPALLPGWLADLATPPTPAGPRPHVGVPAAGRLRGVLSAVLDATPGVDRNSRLYWGACRAAEMVAAGQLGQDAAVTALMEAAAASGLGEREAQATIASGMREVHP